MNKMQPAEIAEEIERFTTEFIDNSADPINYSSKTIKALNYAAAILRKVDKGELVEVVHCGDCRLHLPNEKCLIHSKLRPGNEYYCASGERRDGEKCRG